MNALQFVATSVLIVIALPLVAASPEVPSAAAARRTPFTHFGAKVMLALPGDGATASVDFGSRSDELVTRATFHFRYRYSAELAPGASAIRLTLNDDVIGVLPVTADGAGEVVTRKIEVDPRLVVGFNKLVMSLMGAPGGTPDPARPGLWAEVSGESELEIAVQGLTVADDLAILPEPFFDRHDQRRVTVPFVFSAQPSNSALRAAAVVASWLGNHAQWRGARFPVHLDAPAPGHAIAFAANGERPAFLAQLPPATGPQLRLMTNPADQRSKLLLVLGRDGDDLKAAADALALGGSAMSGASAVVKRIDDKGPRVAYDSPRLVRLDRAMKLGELVDAPAQLQATGRAPALDPIRIELRMPPDLATWRGPGVPLVLTVQYTAPPCTTDSYLDVGTDEELFQVVPLQSASGAIVDTKEIFVPSHHLASRTELQLGFRFLAKDDKCVASPGPVKAAVSPDSTLDFSGFPHYAPMPNLGHFATVGFPFTRFADLSQTVVVLPDKPVGADIEAMLGLMARMGEATGVPATRVRIASPKHEAALADADLLLIGAPPQQMLLEKWAAALPFPLSGNARRVSGIAKQAGFEGTRPIAEIYGFESPITSGRSVVAITAVAPDQMLRVLDALDNTKMRRAIGGSAAFVLPNKVESVQAGRTYSVGFLPPWTGAVHWLSENPLVPVLLAAMTLAALAYAAWRMQRRVTAWRARSRA